MDRVSYTSSDVILGLCILTGVWSICSFGTLDGSMRPDDTKKLLKTSAFSRLPLVGMPLISIGGCNEELIFVLL